MILPSKSRAVIFDMDGVLLLSSAAHDAAYRRALSDYPLKDFCYAKIAGMRTSDAIAAIMANLGRNVTGDELDALVSAKRKFAGQLLSNDTPIHPQAREVIAKLSQRYRLGLASSAAAWLVNLFVERSGTGSYFTCILNESQVGRAKPAPDIYCRAAELLAMPVENCIVVEDAASGIQASKAAKMYAVGVIGLLSDRELRNAGADTTIQQLHELVADHPE